MTLDRALRLLATVHTKDDDQVGFVVVMGVSQVDWMHGYPYSQQQYIEAWEVVRQHLHLKTKPGLHDA